VLKRQRIGNRDYGMPGDSAKDRALSNISSHAGKATTLIFLSARLATPITRSCTNHCNLICAWEQANWVLENLIMARKPP